jgi:dTDP-4-amino-4,6-dideoxygalactose transaminase
VKAIVPVHLYGQMADMDPIMDQAEKYNLAVVEDACQAHGAQYYSRRHEQWFSAGSIGRAAAFSFYPGKNLGACGEAGAVTTNDAEVARKVRIIRDHGQAQKYYHDVEGYNGRLDSIQAGFLSVKLKHLAEWNAKRRQAAARYNQLFAECGAEVITPYEPSWSRAVYHLYVVQRADRDGLRDALNNEGIGTGIHYPIPLHLQKAYSSLGYREGDFPVAENLAKQIVSLPMSTTLTPEQQVIVAEAVQRFVGARVCEQV